jgi:hypothetical protein
VIEVLQFLYPATRIRNDRYHHQYPRCCGWSHAGAIEFDPDNAFNSIHLEQSHPEWLLAHRFVGAGRVACAFFEAPSRDGEENLRREGILLGKVFRVGPGGRAKLGLWTRSITSPLLYLTNIDGCGLIASLKVIE